MYIKPIVDIYKLSIELSDRPRFCGFIWKPRREVFYFDSQEKAEQFRQSNYPQNGYHLDKESGIIDDTNEILLIDIKKYRDSKINHKFYKFAGTNELCKQIEIEKVKPRQLIAVTLNIKSVELGLAKFKSDAAFFVEINNTDKNTPVLVLRSSNVGYLSNTGKTFANCNLSDGHLFDKNDMSAQALSIRC